MHNVVINTLEIVEFVNQIRTAAGNTSKLRHDNFLRKLTKSGLKVPGSARDGYELNKQQAYMLTAGYGVEVADKVCALMHLWEKEGKTPVTAPKPVKPVVVETVSTVAEYVPAEGEITMTSLELVSFINSIRAQEPGYVELKHDDFLKKVRVVLGDGAGNFSGSYSSTQGKQMPLYRFPKREATLMAMSYSHKVSAQIYDRMEALERQVAGVPAAEPFKVPQTFAQALMLAARQAEELETQKRELVLKESALTIAAPKVRFHDNFANQNVEYRATDIAKTLGISAQKLNRWLIDQNVLFHTRKHFKQWYMDKGYGIERFVEAGENVYQNVYHTSAGALWILNNYGQQNEVA